MSNKGFKVREENEASIRADLERQIAVIDAIIKNGGAIPPKNAKDTKSESGNGRYERRKFKRPTITAGNAKVRPNKRKNPFLRGSK